MSQRLIGKKIVIDLRGSSCLRNPRSATECDCEESVQRFFSLGQNLSLFQLWYLVDLLQMKVKKNGSYLLSWKKFVKLNVCKHFQCYSGLLSNQWMRDVMQMKMIGWELIQNNNIICIFLRKLNYFISISTIKVFWSEIMFFSLIMSHLKSNTPSSELKFYYLFPFPVLWLIQSSTTNYHQILGPN